MSFSSDAKKKKQQKGRLEEKKFHPTLEIKEHFVFDEILDIFVYSFDDSVTQEA
jgi:hypothetical protein